MPGPTVLGQPLATGERLKYRRNGLQIALFTWFSYLVATFGIKLFPATILYDHYAELLSTVMIFCLLLSLYLYVSARARGFSTTGNFILDYWGGIELNPMVLGTNLKWFALKASLTGWILLNISFAAKEYELYGEISIRSILYQSFSFIYAADYYLHEPAMLTTWDIISENYGFMLLMGNFWFMWFAWTVPPFYLICDRTEWPIALTAATIIIFTVGYMIFRSSNSQKNDFKANPKILIWGKPAETIGNGRILVSGWWGVLRKPNYLSDWMIATAIALPTGFTHIFSYLYPIYLISLDIHRAFRDDEKCSKKYGRVWTEYKKKVPYMLIPYIY